MYFPLLFLYICPVTKPIKVMRQFNITSYHTVYEDSYENGEGQFVNCWDQSLTVKAYTLDEAMKAYYENDLNWNWEPNSVFVDEDALMDARLVDEDNCIATEKQTERWKRGELKLFNQHVTIKVWELSPLNLEELQKLD